MRTTHPLLAIFSVACVTALICSREAHAQTPATGSKQEMFLGIILQRTHLSSAELAASLVDGMHDGDPAIRELALSALTSRAAGSRFSSDENVRRQWAVDHDVIQQLRPVVEALLNDSNPPVRASVVMALGNLDFDPNAAHLSMKRSTRDTLKRHYYRETDGSIRAEIVKAFALEGGEPADIESLLIDAGKDPDAGVRHYAAIGAAMLPANVTGPGLVRLLSDPDRAVRMAAAQRLGRIGHGAAPYRASVEDALKSEPDPDVRLELTRALNAIAN